MSTPFYKKVRGHLVRHCPVMKRLIAAIGPCTLTPIPGDAFTLIVRSVIYQQISTKAARSIFDKLVTTIGDPTIPMAELAKMSEAKFQACGVSGPKQRTIRAVIDHVKANPDLLPGIADRDNETIREQLTVIKGIGPWTVDMYLMFGLLKPDVLPIGDYGLRVALQRQFNLRKLPDAQRCLKLARPWEPYRSIATWYLWRSLEPQYST